MIYYILETGLIIDAMRTLALGMTTSAGFSRLIQQNRYVFIIISGVELPFSMVMMTLGVWLARLFMGE